ncbi:hypothetical protein SS50377_21807 [Spironucleus salmonicida]|uniref:Uncharacterized protein n=1 Tax=Spironucleus salmonicida TaxID=348837 RepID=V6LZ46_9EUKA|nr:hypothetical protein SS50377_21804 [Spironucleus salmonicida]KAH0576245.1 hypothetical protein SS50377_21807 [Spironucleus salmonicida]|eukprot:EST44805.1 Hypothetical protein SS50377_15314 [Spironucleus salmonicida]
MPNIVGKLQQQAHKRLHRDEDVDTGNRGVTSNLYNSVSMFQGPVKPVSYPPPLQKQDPHELTVTINQKTPNTYGSISRQGCDGAQ